MLPLSNCEFLTSTLFSGLKGKLVNSSFIYQVLMTLQNHLISFSSDSISPEPSHLLCKKTETLVSPTTSPQAAGNYAKHQEEGCISSNITHCMAVGQNHFSHSRVLSMLNRVHKNCSPEGGMGLLVTYGFHLSSTALKKFGTQSLGLGLMRFGFGQP